MQKRITLIAPSNSPDPDFVQCQPPLQTLLQTYKVNFEDNIGRILNQVILSNASHLCKYFYKHTGCAKKVAYRVLMTMLGNLFIELGYLGPLVQIAPLSLQTQKSGLPSQHSKICLQFFWNTLHMGQFLQGGKNGRLMSFFFKSRASV